MVSVAENTIFQFYDSTIKRGWVQNIGQKRRKFQFYDSTIKSSEYIRLRDADK